MSDQNPNSPLNLSESVESRSVRSTAEKRPFHEMGFADILDTTFSLYRDNFRLFIGITATLHIPFGLIKILIVSSFGGEGATQGLSEFLDMIKGLVVQPMVMGALVFAIAQEYLGRESTIGEAFSRVKFWSILGTSWLIGLAAGGLAMTIIGIPFGIYFAFRWSLFCQCIMVEGYNAKGAMSRSRQLVERSWWRVFGIEAVLWILTFLIAFIPVFGLGKLLGTLIETTQLMTSILEIALTIITTPILLIGTTLLYFDLRIRKEAFDIEMMARNIHSVIVCPKCGRQSDSQVKFCQACGTNLQPSTSEPSV